MPRTKATALAALALPIVLAATPARADADDDPARHEARALASKGDEAFAGGRCDLAVPLWKQAESKFHAPTILFRIARCQALLGRAVDATAALEAIVGETLAADAPAAFVDAQNQAKRELPSVRARIATLAVVVESRAEGNAQATVAIDDQPMTGREQRVDPGRHRVRVAARDASWEQSVTLGDGEQRTVRVALTSKSSEPVIPTQRIVGYVIGGVGIASMAIGGIFGAIAVGDSQRLHDACGGNGQHCPASEQPAIDRLKTEALVADLTIGGGAAMFIAGAVVVLTAPAPKREEPRLFIAPMGLGMRVGGSF